MEIKASKKQNNRKSGAALALKEAKRTEAKARQEAYNKLSTVEKLNRLDAAGHTATKQRTKLLVRVQAEDKKKGAK